MKNFILTTLAGFFLTGNLLAAFPSEIVHRTEIHADAATVWHILTDFSDYHSWNSWIRSIGGQAETGQTVQANVRMGGFSMKTLHRVTVVHPLKQLCWEDISWFTFLVGGTRCRTLESTPQGNTLVENRFRFSGILLAPGSYLFRGQVSRGMKLENHDLKSLSESLTAPAGD